MNARDEWTALASVEGVGEETFTALLTAFGSAGGTFQAVHDGRFDAWFRQRRLQDGRVPIVKTTVDNLRAAAASPAERLEALAQHALWTYAALDGDYPARLRDLPNPPFVLHGLGDKSTLHAARLVGVVGTRRPTPAGRALTAKVCARLVECGATVVSGLAVGIDGAAHAATIEHGGTAIGVIGGGHSYPGPRAHTRLRNESWLAAARSSASTIPTHIRRRARSRAATGSSPRLRTP